MAFLFFHSVYTLSVLAVYRLEQPVETIRGGRYYNVMHMIWHQAVRDDLNAMLLSVIAQKTQVCRRVTRVEEYRLAPIAPLCNVMGHSRQ